MPMTTTIKYLVILELILVLFSKRYSVCSLVVPTLEEAILTSVLKKNFK